MTHRPIETVSKAHFNLKSVMSPISPSNLTETFTHTHTHTHSNPVITTSVYATPRLY